MPVYDGAKPAQPCSRIRSLSSRFTVLHSRVHVIWRAAYMSMIALKRSQLLFDFHTRYSKILPRASTGLAKGIVG
jgi:hypothetical protein